MAPTVLLEYTKEKKLKKSLQDLSFTMMGKSHKFSKGYSSGFVPDYRHAVDTMGESEGFGSSGRADSEDSCAPKRKCISLNMDRNYHFNVPLQVISLSKMSSSERKDLEMRLRSELEQIQMFQKKVLSRCVNTGGVALSSSAGVHGKKRDPVGQNASQVKRGISGRFESMKQARPCSVSNSDAMLIKQCEALLKRLMSHQYGWVFNTPVDPVKLKIPDYYTVIKHPMDLGTIKSKITSGAYSSPGGFVADVRLTFTNAMTYNPPGNDVHLMADTLRKFFETRWKPIEKKLAAADARIKQETEAPNLELPSKKRKAPDMNHNIVVPEKVEPKMTDEEKRVLSRRLESMLGDLPDHIIDFLRQHSDNGNQTNEEEIEIDIDSLSDDTLFELRKLLDDYLRDKQAREQAKPEPCEMEILNESGLSNSSMHPCKGNEPADEDVDIGGNDPPMSSYPPVEIEKDTQLRNNKYSSSSSSSSDSSSSSSDSDSGSSSESESDDRVASPTKTAKEHAITEAMLDQEKSEIMNPLDVNRPVSGMDHPEQDARPKVPVEADGHQEGENAPSERQVSPEKLYRAALLRSRFADTILKAREKTLGQGEKGDPEKLQREKEELEKQRREEKARLQAEAKAAEEARRRAEAEAAAEAKRKRELEREAARQALLKMEKTVEISNDCRILKDLEMLRTVPAEHVPSSVDETSPDLSPDGMGGFTLGGSNPLEQLGLYMKKDDEEEEEGEPSGVPVNDVEEGEID
ncbi:transcription factor GTE9-like [Phoenix dactylifera]|uniref:Transcription factor GTE9-like n=1 Tax=Phoenix dactylifera TaxID=42345 RepID=A0A8B8ZJ10_PHODC|nr:transcription factor GTE9-like [Phoenix dactylifera]XP_038974171.1 transcription factor GTE9-like [Phoenix dactylifera]XP_038974172.1 transcription factor GTE9-like [Phoenix dactylifera]